MGVDGQLTNFNVVLSRILGADYVRPATTGRTLGEAAETLLGVLARSPGASRMRLVASQTLTNLYIRNDRFRWPIIVYTYLAS